MGFVWRNTPYFETLPDFVSLNLLPEKSNRRKPSGKHCLFLVYTSSKSHLSSNTCFKRYIRRTSALINNFEDDPKPNHKPLNVMSTKRSSNNLLSQLMEEENDNSKAHSLSKDEYRKQSYKRLINVDNIQSYKARMDSTKILNEEVRVNKLIEQEQDFANVHTAKRQCLPEEGSQSHITQLRARNNQLNASSFELTDAFLDTILPKGYVKVGPPEHPGAPPASVSLYLPPEHHPTIDLELARDAAPEYEGISMNQIDIKHFYMLVQTREDELQYLHEKQRFKAMDVIFKAKKGPQKTRKKANRWISAHVNELGPKAFFGVILPLMLEPDLDESERHILTKITNRAVYNLGEQIRPFTLKIVAAVSPLLIDEDMTLRLEAKETISTISRSAGLANLVTSLRPDLDNSEEYIRNLTARVFAVAATTLGLTKVLPFVKAVIRSKKSSQARHTGIRIIHHICVNLGGGNGATLLPHLPQIVEVLQPGLEDELLPVRIATANTVSLLAENVRPYGIETFEPILEPIWSGLKHHRGRGLAAFLKAMGSLVPLMAYNSSFEEYSNYYMRELMLVMTREFRSPDEDMKKAILRSLLSLPISKEVFPNFREQILIPFFQNFWTRKVALDSNQLCRLVVDATNMLSKKISVIEVIETLSPLAKNANENLRRMAVDAIHKIASNSPDEFIELQERSTDSLVDSVLYAFQEQTQPHPSYLAAVSVVCKVLNNRIRSHMTIILSTVLFRMKNKEPETRLQSADLVAAIAPVLSKCAGNDNRTMLKLILFLYESLGEVYPEVLGSLIGALYACLNTFDTEGLSLIDNPSMNMLLPSLTPILKNRHEKVQENCVKLVGLIARKSADSINAKEWMRVCFDLLDMLKSQRKRIRVASNATFGFIASAIGPQDVLATLLNNLRVQERQLRVCTAVAIGIVADTCVPFTVLPALMNEYRVPDKNVQNGVLKSLSFMFEYINGSLSKDYLHAITPLLENALTDRDQVHRQTAATVVRHLALNCAGHVHDEFIGTFIHFLNLLLPNVYELSPHVIIRILECVDALRLILGPGIFLNYIWTGLFHAARKVRSPFWKIYNTAYIQSCDALVPCYPRVDRLQDSLTSYNVKELDVWI